MKTTLVTPAARSAAAALLLVGPMLAGAPITHAQAVNDAALEKSVVLLETQWIGNILIPAKYASNGHDTWTPDAVATYSTCSAFYVSGSAQMVTAGHCVDPAVGRTAVLQQFLTDQNAMNLYNEAVDTWTVEGKEKGSPVISNVEAVQPQGVDGATITSPTTVQVVDFRSPDKGDVALLKLPNMSKPTPALSIASSTPKQGDQITSIGFPAQLRGGADQSQIARASFKTGTISSQQVSPSGVVQLEVNSELSGGMSGGPTVDKNGDVVGVNVLKSTGDANFNFITDTDDLVTFLKSHNVDIAGPQAAGSSSNWKWYLLGAGIALVLGLAAAVSFLRRRGGPPPVAGPVQPVSGTPSGASAQPGEPTTASAFGRAPSTAPPMAEQWKSVTIATPSADTAAVSDEAAEPGVTAAPPPGPVGGPEAVAPESTLTEVAHFCANCGTERHEGERFCRNCGHALG
ncbi:trypsin-like peptidase domain-containing protein [Nocardia stercoris]|uniref:Zinc-ribbon domain-containing protein n=1 Tax=Nocardia stercoris TaxID=2483361 RepID=A0A3M2L4S4_9NOCA|nr:trypsin-like peptidase domain-containing protein [Nocardia stercoris]RMI31710.1 hypothetical protein EBN03_16010 [Nocardia stercoris]